MLKVTWRIKSITLTTRHHGKISSELQETFLDWLPKRHTAMVAGVGDLLGGWWPVLLKAKNVPSELTLKIHQIAMDKKQTMDYSKQIHIITQ